MPGKRLRESTNAPVLKPRGQSRILLPVYSCTGSLTETHSTYRQGYRQQIVSSAISNSVMLMTDSNRPIAEFMPYLPSDRPRR